MADVDPQSLRGSRVRSFDLPLQISSLRSGCSRTTDQGDLPYPRPLRLSPHSRRSSARGLASRSEQDTARLSQIGPAIAQQNTQAPGQGQAPRRPQARDKIERDLDEASKVVEGNPKLEVASIGVGGKPIPGDGEPVVGALKAIPGYYVAFSHSGATLGLIVGELLAYEVATGTEHPMLATFRPERFESP